MQCLQKACQPRQPHNIQRLEVLRADLIHPRRLATEELTNYLSDFGLGDGRVHLRVPSLCFPHLEGKSVGLRRSSKYFFHRPTMSSVESTVNAGIYQEILEHFMLHCADKLYGDADFIFQQDLAPSQTAKCIKSWFSDHGVVVLDWPENSPDLNPIENLWGIVERKMSDTRPNNADDLKAAIESNLGFHYT
ncbi:hypothetical protein L3Q82_006818 [Scortum barcoo]|uniref:Uncharacterized protein n=1 Tax=Scortum barcoo TaxID=214431 RepID=A0ACB8WXB4_9TELE|nr:hypothetical protein L3Q82_006818 [Scortum barcoo]